MMDEQELMAFSDRFKDARQLERDYLLILLLHEIYSVFANELVFKGGTALKYFYSLNRFSEDLDFSYLPKGDGDGRKAMGAKMDAALGRMGAQYRITETEHRMAKSEGSIVGVNYVIRVMGPLNARLGHLQNIKVDVSLRDDTLRKPEPKYLSPIYPDITTFSLPVMDINEMLAEKITAITERVKMRDIYDVYYLISIKGIRYDGKLVEEKLRKRGKHFKLEELAKRLDAANDKRMWRSELAYIVTPLPDNSEVVLSLKRAFGIQD